MTSSQPLVREDSHDCSRHAADTVGQAAAILGMLHRIPADHAEVSARLTPLADRSADIACELLGESAGRCALGRALHSVVIHLRTTAELANRHRVTVLADELVEIIGIVQECGQNTARSFAAPLDSMWAAHYRAEILRLADDADDAFRRLFARWYFDTDDLTTVAGMREVGDELENVVRAFESVADAAVAADRPGELVG
ncbi:hypothetical protein [Nocardia arthritidis]|uniref:hypothetical protein n=1 Tax=Nocardia arthritidis TaxID=228602 RepID=UPI0007A55623|nr:hypothetical protein [Nocardia arthritidis]